MRVGLDVGGTKRKVELVTLDNQSDPSLATTQARKLILDEGAVALVGPCTPPISIPVAQVAEKEKVPMVGTCVPVGAFEAGSDSGWTYAWDLFFSETDQAATAFKAFDQIEGSNKKVALFTDTEPDGIIERELYKKAAAEAGYEVVGDYSFPVGTTDYGSFVNDAKARGAQLVIAQVIPPDGFALWKAMKALGLNPLGAFCAKAAAGSAWLSLEAVGEGTLTEAFWMPTGGFPEAADLDKELASTLKTTADRGVAVATYSAMQVLADAITEAGSTDADKINEAIGTTEVQFAKIMNAEARRLGMTNTHFTNSTGLPDPEHYTTARDLAILTSHLISEFPEYYKLYSQREYTYNNIRQPNRNRLLFTDPTVDGVKTGHTQAAGYCLISSALREDTTLGVGRRLVSVVLGANSEASRAIESQKLLNFGYQNYQLMRLYRKGEPLDSYRVYKGRVGEVKAGFLDDVLVTVARNDADKVKGEVERAEPLLAPIPAGTRLGLLRVRLGDRPLLERPLVALETVEAAGWFGRAWDTIKLWIQ